MSFAQFLPIFIVIVAGCSFLAGLTAAILDDRLEERLRSFFTKRLNALGNHCAHCADDNGLIEFLGYLEERLSKLEATLLQEHRNFRHSKQSLVHGGRNGKEK